MITYKAGRKLRGLPLALAVAVREFFLAEFTDGGEAPSYAHLTDRVTGNEFATIALGRDLTGAALTGQALDRDLLQMSRDEFLAKWAPGSGPNDSPRPVAPGS
jgi:hypothetical protein